LLATGESIAAPRLTLSHLSLLDRYWQFRLQAYRHAFLEFSPVRLQWEHGSALSRQLMVDIHPTFGAYILYILALGSRLEADFLKTLDYLELAKDWIESWRIRGDKQDLNEKASCFILRSLMSDVQWLANVNPKSRVGAKDRRKKSRTYCTRRLDG
jgi:hypothetical protein